MALKYYAEEDARHIDVLHIHWTFEQCKSATDALCDHFGLPRIKVLLSKRSFVKSSYNTSSRLLTYHEAMLNPLTVAHEFAHYADHLDRIQKNISVKIRWHGARHLIRTNQSVEFVKTLPYYAPAKVTRLAGIREWKSDVKSPGSLIIDAAYALLPEYCHCPKCKLNKPKKDFGMRVMSRGEGGIPTKVSRQSYCQSCRSTHKE